MIYLFHIILFLFLLLPQTTFAGGDVLPPLHSPGTSIEEPHAQKTVKTRASNGSSPFQEPLGGEPGYDLPADDATRKTVSNTTIELWNSQVFLISSAGVGAALILLVASFFLRAQVKAKARELEEKNLQLQEEIEEKRAMEEALRSSESRYRGVFENTGTATALINEDNTVFIANSEFERLSGYSRQEIDEAVANDITWMQFVHPDDLSRIQEFHEYRRRNRDLSPAEYEFRFVDRNGKIRHVLNRVGIILETRQYVSSIMDITSRKRTELALKQSEEKYRTILQSIVEGYYEVDLRGNFVFVNDATCGIFDYPRETLLNMNLTDFTDEENSRRGREAFGEVYTSGHALDSFEWEIIRKDRSERHVEASVSLVKDERGLNIGFRGILHDITDRKIVEDERNRLTLQLRQAQKMEALGTLAGGIAHNFNNLLMGIQGYASILLLEADNDDPRCKMIENIQKQVQSGSRLTTQLLGYAREGQFTVQAFSLNNLIREIAVTFGTTRKDILIRTELAEDLLPIMADHGQIEQTLMNLLINAAEAMLRGGEVVITTLNAVPEMMTDRPYSPKPGRYVRLSVSDSGIGMDNDTREKIFDPFFTTKGLVNGTGLGLASVYGTIKAHGGYIDVESEEGEGTTFHIFLPSSIEESVKHKSGEKAEAMRGNECVLMIDDEEIVLEVGSKMLRQLGYKVIEAGTGKKALEIYKIRHRTIDLVIFDMIMPEIGGLELFLKLMEIDKETLALLSSGYGLNDAAREILESGCKGFIHKPYDINELSRKVRMLLDSHSPQTGKSTAQVIRLKSVNG
jgi:PAS domain S-box-containing protein